jgi:hypothetical protein
MVTTRHRRRAPAPSGERQAPGRRRDEPAGGRVRGPPAARDLRPRPAHPRAHHGPGHDPRGPPEDDGAPTGGRSTRTPLTAVNPDHGLCGSSDGIRDRRRPLAVASWPWRSAAPLACARTWQLPCAWAHSRSPTVTQASRRRSAMPLVCATSPLISARGTNARPAHPRRPPWAVTRGFGLIRGPPSEPFAHLPGTRPPTTHLRHRRSCRVADGDHEGSPLDTQVTAVA